MLFENHDEGTFLQHDCLKIVQAFDGGTKTKASSWQCCKTLIITLCQPHMPLLLYLEKKVALIKAT